MAMAGSVQALGLSSPLLQQTARRPRSCRAARTVTRAVVPHAPRTKAGKAALAVLSSLLAPAAYAEELGQQLSASEVPQWSGVPVPSFDQVPDDFVSILQANPIFLLGGVAIIAIPVLLAQGLLPASGPKPKATRAEKALEALSAEARTLLVDIRSTADVKAEGSPALGKVMGKSLAVPFTKVAKDGSVLEVEGWAARLAKSLKEDTIVILLDADGKLAAKAGATLLAEAAFESLYFVQEGAEGWKGKDLPWKVKAKFGFSLPSGLDFDTLAADFKDAPSLGRAALAVGAIGGASVLLFNELGSALELVGLFGAVNLLGRNFLFAEDRKKTSENFRSLVEDKIAVEDVGSDLKQLALRVLETPEPAAVVAAQKVDAAVAEVAQEPEAAPTADTPSKSEEGEARKWIENWREKA